MKLTAELSLYPLNENYIPVIQAFIDEVKKDDELTIVTNAMSTQLCGDYEKVFSVVQKQLRTSFEQFGKQVLVCKFIVGELDIADA